MLTKQILEISQQPAHLAVRNEQLLLKRGGEVVGQAPCEDLGVVVVDHPQTTYTHHALAKLAEGGTAVVLCGRDHLPVAMVLPLVDHTHVVWRLADQIAASRPLQKRLWQQLVVAKIKAQAANLEEGASARKKMLALAGEVRSGDPSNIEAQAAKLYWRHWLDSSDLCVLDSEPFRRNTSGSGLNGFLNYGYAVLRAAIGRAIVASGLQPSLGIHHCNRGNAYCLADDLIEPLRPLVDDRVRELHRLGHDTLNQEAKAELLRVLTAPVELNGISGPLMGMLHRMAASLVRCYAGEQKKLDIPVVELQTQ